MRISDWSSDVCSSDLRGVIPQERPDDAHDILGTYRIVSDQIDMKTLPADFEQFLSLLRRRHAAIMEARPDKSPGAFKTKANRAGQTVFVAPELVTGTLEKGFAFLQGQIGRAHV